MSKMSDLELEEGVQDELTGEGSEGELMCDSDSSNEATATSTRMRSKITRSPLVACHLCGRPYHSLPGYVYASAPGREASKEFLWEASKDVLEEIRLLLGAGCAVNHVKTTALVLLSLDDESLWAFVDKVNTAIEECLPASSWNSVADLNNIFVSRSNAVLNDDPKCTVLKDGLIESIEVEVPEEALHWIFAQFFNKLSAKFESFYLQFLKEPLQCLLAYSLSKDLPMDNNNTYCDLDDLDFQRSAHYVSRSCVKSVLDISLRSKSESWLRIRSTIQCKMLTGELVNGPSEKIESWTRRRDRGGLKFVSESVYVFFMALTGLVKDLTGEDGSVPHEGVLNRVKDDSVLILLWDNVQVSLGAGDNDLLLNNICQKFLNACVHGEVLRRNNAVTLFSRDKASLRSNLSK